MKKCKILIFVLLVVSFGNSSEKELPTRFEKWLDQEVVYIITPLEKEVFLQLHTDRERENFIEAFWKHRDPTPGTPKNEFKEEHYRRINYANYHFGRSTSKTGWKTDRGRIYIILGEPMGINRYTDETQIYNTEVWFYQGLVQYSLPSGFNLVFFQKGGAGEYVLYSPISDGPQALLTTYLDDQANYSQAFQTLRRIHPNLANVSLSLIPGESHQYGHPSLASDILIQNIHTVPKKKLNDKYAQKFLSYKDKVEVEYSANYIDNDSSVVVLKNPQGIYFVHYVVELMKFSVQKYKGKYSTHLKINGNISDSEGKTIYQYDDSISVKLDEDQLKSITYKPFDIYDIFPLIAGSYKFSVIIKNETSKEFTTVEKNIVIPEDNSSLSISPLLLGYKMSKDSSETQNLKPFKLGSFQIFHQPKNIFHLEDTLFLAFQINGLSSNLRKKGKLKYEIFKGDDLFFNLTKKVNQYEGGMNFKQEFSLQEFPSGYYRIQVSLLDGEKEIISEEENFEVSPISKLPRPWVHTKTLSPPDRPVYFYLLGKQLLNKGEISKAQAKFEYSFQKEPDSLNIALNLAKVYSIQKKHHKVKLVLMDFSDISKVPYQLYSLLGNAHQSLGEFDKAINVFKKALSHYGENLYLLNSLGECYYNLGIWNKALSVWKRSLEIKANQPKVEEKIKILEKKLKIQKKIFES